MRQPQPGRVWVTSGAGGRGSPIFVTRHKYKWPGRLALARFCWHGCQRFGTGTWCRVRFTPWLWLRLFPADPFLLLSTHSAWLPPDHGTPVKNDSDLPLGRPGPEGWQATDMTERSDPQGWRDQCRREGNERDCSNSSDRERLPDQRSAPICALRCCASVITDKQVAKLSRGDAVNVAGWSGVRRCGRVMSPDRGSSRVFTHNGRTAGTRRLELRAHRAVAPQPQAAK